MKKALGIARVSTERQSANDRVSHDEQDEKIRRWCEANGYECVDVLREVVSRDDELQPTRPETRPVFWGAYRRLEEGQVDAIVFWEPDRFCAGLEGADFPYWLAQARKHGDGIRFTANEPPREGRYATVMAAVAGSQAHESWDRLVDIMQQGREGHAKLGQFAGGALPFWLRWVKPVKHEDGSVTRGYFESRAEEKTLMLRIIDMFESGLGSERIANILTGERVPTPSTRSPQWREHSKKRRDGVWDGATILSVLHNRALCGEYRFGGRPRKTPKTKPQEPTVIPVPPLITTERFEAIQQQMVRNKKMGSARRSGGWPLQGLIFSEACGFTYQARTDGRTGRRVYRCPGRMRRRHRDDPSLACSCPPLPAVELERDVVAATRKLLQDPEARRRAVADYIASLESRQSALRARLAPIDDDLRRIQEGIDNLAVEVALGRLSRERYEREVGDLEAKRRRLRDRRGNFEAVERELQQVEETLAAINNTVDEGLLHVAVVAHGGHGRPSAIEWLDDDSDDPVLRQESFSDLARRMHMRIVVRRNGHVEITGLFQPIEIDHPTRPRTASAPADSGRRRRG